MFQFPKDPEMFQKWRKSINEKNVTPTENSRVCSIHFKESDFKKNSFDSNVRRRKWSKKDVEEKIFITKCCALYFFK